MVFLFDDAMVAEMLASLLMASANAFKVSSSAGDLFTKLAMCVPTYAWAA